MTDPVSAPPERPIQGPTPLKSQRFVNRMLVLFCLLLLAATIASSGALGPLPYLTGSSQLHVLLGLIATVAIILAHTLAFFYLIETSINLKKAVAQRGVSQEFVDRHTPLKKRVWPIAFWSMVLVAAAAIFGGGVDSGAVPKVVHQVLAWAATITTLIAWWIEDRVLGQTRALIDQVNADIRTRVAAGDLSAGIEPDPTEGAPRDIAEPTPAETAWMLGRWLVFVGPSLWLWFAYQRWVIGAKTWSLTFYVVTSIAMTGIGLVLIEANRYRGELDGHLDDAGEARPADQPVASA